MQNSKQKHLPEAFFIVRALDIIEDLHVLLARTRSRVSELGMVSSDCEMIEGALEVTPCSMSALIV